jgi:hypothetical protein
VASSNPHYFKDASGAAIVLAGSQTWNTLQDWGSDGTLETLDFDAYVRFLTANMLESNYSRVSGLTFSAARATATHSPEPTILMALTTAMSADRRAPAPSP